MLLSQALKDFIKRGSDLRKVTRDIQVWRSVEYLNTLHVVSYDK